MLEHASGGLKGKRGVEHTGRGVKGKPFTLHGEGTLRCFIR